MNNTTLFGYHSFIQGTASIVDLGGTLQEDILPTDNNEAIKDDWKKVGKDITSSIATYEKDFPQSSK